MGFFDRAALVVFALVTTVASLVLFLAVFDVTGPLNAVLAGLHTVNGRWLTGILSGIVFLISIRFFYVAFRRTSVGQALVRENDLGEVRVSIYAVRNLMRRVAAQTRGVREARAEVGMTPDGLAVHTRLVLSPDASVPETTELVQKALRDTANEIVGVKAAAVNVDVVNISAEVRGSR